MITLPNVLSLQILLHSYCMTSPFERTNAPAVRDAIEWLLRADMIKQSLTTTDPDVYEVTDRGRAFVHHIMATPLPAQKWYIPERTIDDGQQ